MNGLGFVELSVRRVRWINQFLRLATLVHALHCSYDEQTFAYQEKLHLSDSEGDFQEQMALLKVNWVITILLLVALEREVSLCPSPWRISIGGSRSCIAF